MATIKKYYELTHDEIFNIFQSRINIFVVEQKCPYKEIDEYDKIAYHAYINDNNNLASYCRIIFKNDYAIIGRVITTIRNKGYGKKILLDAIEFIKNNGYKHIEIEAQTYAIGFYEKVGFIPYGNSFLMDDILHVKMKLFLD